ncbi:MAG TPA: hypothetical protein VNX68_07660 [Nitrosopumilaceae archaeon]|nr:hypothetical protein [Nitrosopumilaceae archaeon]
MDRTVADEDICSFGGTMYETYGEEESYIRQMAKDSPRRVWTIIEADGGEPHIVAGFHYVNRMGFMITEKEWTTGDDEVENN